VELVRGYLWGSVGKKLIIPQNIFKIFDEWDCNVLNFGKKNYSSHSNCEVWEKCGGACALHAPTLFFCLFFISNKLCNILIRFCCKTLKNKNRMGKIVWNFLCKFKI
jgi:hypothetical protein